jgi:hypothetical protein
LSEEEEFEFAAAAGVCASETGVEDAGIVENEDVTFA